MTGVDLASDSHQRISTLLNISCIKPSDGSLGVEAAGRFPSISTFDKGNKTMSRFTKWMLAAFLVAGLAIVDATPSQAGNGFGYGRYGMFGSPNLYGVRASSQPRTTSSCTQRYPMLLPRATTMGSYNMKNKTNSGYNWPGTMRSPSYRYQPFQDVNGYWN